MRIFVAGATGALGRPVLTGEALENLGNRP